MAEVARDSERVLTYKGRPLETLSREELLTACRWAYREIASLRYWEKRDLEMADLFASVAANA